VVTPGTPRTDSRMLRVRVQSEFGRLRCAIVHDASNAADVTMEDWRWLLSPEDLAQHPATGPASRDRVIEQVTALHGVLRERGVRLLLPEPQPEAVGQLFTRDPCFAIGDTVFLAGLHDPWRLSEQAGLRSLQQQFARVIDLRGRGALIEGGDVVLLDEGRTVLVGMCRHTNDAGLARLAQALDGTGLALVRVPHRGLHLDCCLAPLPDGTALYAPNWLPESSRALVAPFFERLLPIDADEAGRLLAANLLWLDPRTVLSNGAATRTNALLREHDFDVIPLEAPDLIAMWGSFRCAVCPIERDG
jgi:N-dimethylarginine dimethylaminohydrolase